METDADLHRHPLRALHLITVAGHGLLHTQRRIAGAYGVVFMGKGRTEEGGAGVIGGKFTVIYNWLFIK